MSHEPDAAPQRYPHVLRAIRETPWAVREETLAVIEEIIALRASGERLTAEEIQARIGGPPPSGRGPSYTAGSVTVLPLFGVIFPRANLVTAMSGATSLQQFHGAFQDALEDGSRAILIDVDSPGGTIDLVPEVAAAIRAARGEKPIWAIANTHADSAAYWLAAQTDRVIVTDSGEVGSIGILSAHQDRSGMEEKLGVKTTLVTAGKYKGERSPFEPLSDEAREAIQERVDEHYAMFVADVARGRGVTAKTVRSEFGQGRTVSPKRALEVGMVDEIATFEATLEKLNRRRSTSSRGSTRGVGDFVESHFSQEDDPSDSGGIAFADEAQAALAAAEGLVERASSLAELRRTDGRGLSAANRERLSVIADAFHASGDALAELVASNPDQAELTRREHLRFEHGRHLRTRTQT
jgi:capsid assembly protease